VDAALADRVTHVGLVRIGGDEKGGQPLGEAGDAVEGEAPDVAAAGPGGGEGFARELDIGAQRGQRRARRPWTP
jgi:hypothetical protein